MNEITVLDIESNFGGVAEVIHPVVLRNDESAVLVDCGYNGFLNKLEAALIQKNIRPEELTHVVITHHDHDHMGALAALKRKYPDIVIVASADEAPYISGEAKSPRLAQAEALQTQLQPEQKGFGEAFMNLLRAIQPAEVDKLVSDGDELDFCDGCTIIGTPGHMPGHISLYLSKIKVIIAGDAMALEDGRPAIANPQFTLDMERAKSSLDKLLSMEADTIICYHGGIYRKPYNEAKVNSIFADKA